jgi:hypothetical protein
MKTRRWMVILGLVFITTVVVSAQSNQDGCYAKGGLWDDATSKCTLKEGFEVDVNYPLFISQYPFAEQTIDAFIKDYKSTFEQSYTPVDNIPAYANFWTLTMDYQQFQHSPAVISLLFTISTYTGGAHPNEDFKTFTFDVQNQKEIMLNDLFVAGSNPWPTIAPMVQQSLETRLSTAIGAPLADEDKQTIQNGTGEDPQNYQNFVLDGDSLVFYFPPYQVAAYAAGPQSVSIPLSSLNGFINADAIGA